MGVKIPAEVVVKRLLIIFFTFALIAVALVSAVSAQNFPATSAPVAGPRQPAAVSAQQQMVYAYAPPPPIRQTWPGGYRVIFHEILNTLSEHFLGHY